MKVGTDPINKREKLQKVLPHSLAKSPLLLLDITCIILNMSILPLFLASIMYSCLKINASASHKFTATFRITEKPTFKRFKETVNTQRINFRIPLLNGDSSIPIVYELNSNVTANVASQWSGQPILQTVVSRLFLIIGQKFLSSRSIKPTLIITKPLGLEFK